MPYISTRTNVAISKEKERVLKERLGKAIECLPGKSEAWLMTEFSDNCRLWFKGDNSKPIAFVEIKIFGKSDNSSYATLTSEICRIMNEELAVPPECTYVKYEEISHWGWNGSNF